MVGVGRRGRENSWAQSSPPVTYSRKAERQEHLPSRRCSEQMQAAIGTGTGTLNQVTDLMHHLEQFELMAAGSGRRCAASTISRA